MEGTYLREVLSGTAIFNQIYSSILEWDLSELNGKGLYYKVTGRGDYGHIELKVYRSPNENFRNWVVWSIPKERLLVQDGITKSVEKVLIFFIELVSTIKGENIKLRFEITDGTYHPIDSNKRAFEIATMYALLNAFDENLHEIGNHRKEIIAKMKTKALEKYKIDSGKK